MGEYATCAHCGCFLEIYGAVLCGDCTDDVFRSPIELESLGPPDDDQEDYSELGIAPSDERP